MGDDPLLGRRLGGFAIVEVLGQGGFATVYRARQLRLGRDVALKVLDPMLARDPDVARRFDREGWAAAGLDHPGVVPVYEAGEEDGIWYLAMRIVEGRSLAEELAATGSLPAARTARVVRAVGDALDHAHARGVLHRDVKPANILLEGDRVWLSDFGIAATAELVGAYTSGAIGTPAYMAPEQASVGQAEPRTDLYALGCVAFECLLGRTPFHATGFAEFVYAHRYDPIPGTGDAALDAFFGRALAKAPAERFESGAELADQLERIATARASFDPDATQDAERPPKSGDDSTFLPSATPQLDGRATTDAEIAGTSTPRGATGGAGRERRGRRAWFAIGAALLALIAASIAVALRPTGESPRRAGTATSAPNAATRQATLSKTRAATDYLGAVAPVNAAQGSFVTKSNSWSASTTPSQAESDAQAYLAAVVQVQDRLAVIAASYPSAAADLNGDSEAAAKLQANLVSLNQLNAGISVAAWRAQYNAVIANLAAASNVVRSALGLPTTAS